MTTNSPIPDGATERAVPESLRGRSLTVSLTVNDLAKSLAWYQDVVGFTVDRKHEREGKLLAVSLKAGDVRILIGQDDGAKWWDRVKGRVLHADHDGPERRRPCETDQGARWHPPVGAGRHAVGSAYLPVAGSGRIQADDLVG